MATVKIEVGKTYTSKNDRTLRMKAVEKSERGGNIITYFEVQDSHNHPFVKCSNGLYGFIDRVISDTLEEVTEYKEFNPNLN